MQFIKFSFPSIPQVRCIFQTRQEGFSHAPYAQGNIAFNVGDDPEHVLKNRRSLLRALNISLWAEVNQVHGSRLILRASPTPVDAPTPGSPLTDADGLATDQPGLALLIKTADCQPVFLTSEDGRHIAALHVGWKGNRINFIKSAVSEFCSCYGLDPAKLAAVRGPSLGPDKSEFINFVAEWGDQFLPWYNQRANTVDLWQLTVCQLMKAGLKRKNIFSIDLCTYANPDLFFSYRRDQRLTGRQASVIWIAA
ncbi:MAG: peptidoglycan editing factor PgeF [Desulfovibrionaceae bacterium]|nr:peptidoglycan editing factor PgeF [Desulfovibrionaceae bacterium]